MVDKKRVLGLHKKAGGKIEVMPKVMIDNEGELSIYYTPGVSYVSEEIKGNADKAYDYTSKSNTIAIVSDGTRILGLGDIGPYAGIPVMEGKAALFKKFGGVDAVPLCIGTTDEDEIVKLIKAISPNFGGINIEDIESPKSFRIVERLSEELDIPIFHDDRHGTGVVALAALLNSLKLTGRGKGARIVVNGAGSAGFGIATQLISSGFRNMVVLDKNGAIYKGRESGMNPFKEEIASHTNARRVSGDLADMLKDADVLIGASERGAFGKDHIALMNGKPIVFALANPYPEIEYDEAKDAGAYIVATGRSDKPNQVNNILAFPGIMRGLLDSRAKAVSFKMLHNAAVTIARSVGRRLSTEFIIPYALERGFAFNTVPKVAASVAESAAAEGLARKAISFESEFRNAERLIRRYDSMERISKRFLVGEGRR